jgi:glutamate racemase
LDGEACSILEKFSTSKVSAVAKRIIEILEEDQQVNVLLACNTAANRMGLKSI